MPVTHEEIIDTLRTMSAREACDDAGVTLEYLIAKGKKELGAKKSDREDWAVRQKARSLFHDIRQDKPPVNVKVDLPKADRITFIMNMSGEEPLSKPRPAKVRAPKSRLPRPDKKKKTKK